MAIPLRVSLHVLSADSPPRPPALGLVATLDGAAPARLLHRRRGAGSGSPVVANWRWRCPCPGPWRGRWRMVWRWRSPSCRPSWWASCSPPGRAGSEACRGRTWALLAPMPIWGRLGAGAGGSDACLSAWLAASGLASGGAGLGALAGPLCGAGDAERAADQLHAHFWWPLRRPTGLGWPCCSAQPAGFGSPTWGASGGTAGALGLCGARLRSCRTG